MATSILAAGKFPHRGGGRLTHDLGQPVELGRVEIAEQDLDLHFGHAARNHVVGMQEAVAAVGRLGRERVVRQARDEIAQRRGRR